MSEREATVIHEGKETHAFEVPILESIERWSEIKLEDGTVLRAKLSVGSAHRLDGVWDPQGNPTYQLALDAQIRVIETKESLRKKV